VFSPHPTGGAIAAGTGFAAFPGKELGANRLLVNALLYAARITGNEGG